MNAGETRLCLSCRKTGVRACDSFPVDARTGKHINPETGCAPICEWGHECARGFVSNERFARPGDRVIERTNREKTREWMRAERDSGRR